MNEYKLLDAKTTAKRLRGLSLVAILIHKNPDGDAVGSAAALANVLTQLGARPYVMSPDKIPDRLKFILDYTCTSVREEALTNEAISIDVASPAQLGSLYNTAPKPFLMIDHHEMGEQFADGYIVPGAASASEALFDVIEVLLRERRILLTKELAFALYAATSSDTGCFAYSNASAKTHALAARLIATGIDTADINHRLFNSKSPEQIRAEGFVASKIQTALDGRVAYATLALDEIARLGLKSEYFETAIDIVRSLRGVEVAFIVKETEKGKYKGSLRSVGANVAEVAANFGGGGHIRAAGCSVTAESIEEAATLLLNEINKITELK
jgi:phosphoesterase RecJ-like protein